MTIQIYTFLLLDKQSINPDQCETSFRPKMDIIRVVIKNNLQNRQFF